MLQSEIPIPKQEGTTIETNLGVEITEVFRDGAPVIAEVDAVKLLDRFVAQFGVAVLCF